MYMLNEIDIHGFTVSEAKAMLDRYLDRLPASIHEITVIHGFQRGTTLQQFIRRSYRHPRLQRTMLSMNQGQTTMILK